MVKNLHLQQDVKNYIEFYVKKEIINNNLVTQMIKTLYKTI